MSSSSTLAVAELRDGPLYRFADWPNPKVRNGRIGVSTVSGGDELIYAGMAGRTAGPSAATNGPASAKLTGLPSRLASHASGRRSADRFCSCVFDRLVLPALSLQQIQDAARGQLSLDRLTRQLIRQSPCYRSPWPAMPLRPAPWSGKPNAKGWPAARHCPTRSPDPPKPTAHDRRQYCGQAAGQRPPRVDSCGMPAQRGPHRTILDNPPTPTDQKVGGSSPSERAQVRGPYPHPEGAFLLLLWPDEP
jgi:hypothetical protein